MLTILKWAGLALVTWTMLWAVFGNEDDSLIGDTNWNPERKRGPLIWARWWLRNPFHNLFAHVLALPRVFWMVSWPKQPAPGPWLWPAADPGVLFALYNLAFPLVSFRTRGWEGYLGWRGSAGANNAALGASIRRRKP